MHQDTAFQYEVEGAVRERFWGFFNSNAQNAEGLAGCIVEQLSVLLIGDRPTYSSDIRWHSHEQRERRCTYNHQTVIPVCTFCALICTSIKFNYGKGSITESASSFFFFSSLAAVPAFFTESLTQFAILDLVSKWILGGSDTRWNFNKRLVNTV
jgi:hypothetical protein